MMRPHAAQGAFMRSFSGWYERGHATACPYDDPHAGAQPCAPTEFGRTVAEICARAGADT